MCRIWPLFYDRFFVLLLSLCICVYVACVCLSLSACVTRALTSRFSVCHRASFLSHVLCPLCCSDCTGVDQSVIGGAAHLTSFIASHNAPAAYFVQSQWNKGRPAAAAQPEQIADGEFVAAFARERYVSHPHFLNMFPFLIPSLGTHLVVWRSGTETRRALRASLTPTMRSGC